MSPFIFRFCPQGIPSGKNKEDMLNEVRKEAFSMRKTKKTEKEGGEEEEDDDEETQLPEGSHEISSIVGSEKWETWYPMEWIGWVMYGTPSENPTTHWVNQPTSSGPTDVDHYYTDEAGKRVSKKPPGRNVQRQREQTDTINTKTVADGNTMLSQRIVQMNAELAIASSAHQLQIIDRLQKNAKTAEEIEDAADLYREYLQDEAETVRKSLAEKRAKRLKDVVTTAITTGPNLCDNTPNIPRDVQDLSTSNSVQSSNAPMEAMYHAQYDNESDDMFTPYENMIGFEDSYPNQSNQPQSYSGQIFNLPHSTSESMDFTQSTSPTQLYVSESSASQSSRSGPSNTRISTVILPSRPIIPDSCPSQSSSIGESLLCFQIGVEPTVVTKGRPPLAPRTKTIPPTVALEKGRSYNTRNTPAKSNQLPTIQDINPYRNKDYEYVNTILHGRYPIIKPGVLTMKNFDFIMAKQDLILLKDLKANDVEDDEDLFLIKLWINKLLVAIRKETTIDSDSEDE